MFRNGATVMSGLSMHHPSACLADCSSHDVCDDLFIICVVLYTMCKDKVSKPAHSDLNCAMPVTHVNLRKACTHLSDKASLRMVLGAHWPAWQIMPRLPITPKQR